MLFELEKINKNFEIAGTKREILKNISLKINKGESIAIIGPSGSGKTTLLNIIGTLDLPSSGLIKFNNVDLKKHSENQLAEIRNQNIGFIFQLHHLLPQLSLLENVLVPTIPQKDKSKRKSAQKRAMNLLNDLGLIERINQRPGQLSGGECQRAAVVRALINEPSIILADEPTGSLDNKSAEQIGKLLSDITKNHNIATVVVTHSTKLANMMDKVYRIENGNLIVNVK